MYELYKKEMTKANLKWAKEHDWGNSARLENGLIFVRDEYLEKDVAFGTMQQLRIWAGY